MSHEKKFRAWKKSEKRYVEWPELLADADILKMALNRVMFETIEQYTGLKDKHGKEAYTGDSYMVNINPEDEVLYSIVWLSKMACFALWPQEARDDLPPIYGTEFTDLIENNVSIGNIHTETQNGKEEN